MKLKLKSKLNMNNHSKKPPIFPALFLIFSSLFCLMFAVNGIADPAANAKNPEKAKLLAISGSARADSSNKKLLLLLAKAATEAGATVTTIDLADYSMPIYDGDIESKQGIPEKARELQKLIANHDGLLIASPEYNGLPSPLLKNAIDWATRPINGNSNSGIKIFEGKTAAIVSASPSQFGGIRGLPITAQLLSNIGLLVIPERVVMPDSYRGFNDQGELMDKSISDAIKKEGKAIAKITNALINTR